MIKQARLSKHISRRIANGHPYIYHNEIDTIKGAVEKGEIMDVFTFSGQFVGKGYYNPDSKIIIRLITRSNDKIDGDFIRKRLKTAWAYRKKFISHEQAYRVFNGLSDGISGISCDRFDDLFCVSSSTAGGDRLLNGFIDSLIEMGAQRIIIRNTPSARKKERIPASIQPVKGDISHTHSFKLNGIRFFVDPFSQEDPFFYLEQRENAVHFSQIAKKVFPYQTLKVYDFFSGYGQFGLNLLKAGFKTVEFVESNGLYGPLINKSAQGFQLEDFTFNACNAFDYIHRMDIEHDKADLIILDPPPFTESR